MTDPRMEMTLRDFDLPRELHVGIGVPLSEPSPYVDSALWVRGDDVVAIAQQVGGSADAVKLLRDMLPMLRGLNSTYHDDRGGAYQKWIDRINAVLEAEGDAPDGMTVGQWRAAHQRTNPPAGRPSEEALAKVLYEAEFDADSYPWDKTNSGERLTYRAQARRVLANFDVACRNSQEAAEKKS